MEECNTRANDKNFEDNGWIADLNIFLNHSLASSLTV
jgi:hypothetical protein